MVCGNNKEAFHVICVLLDSKLVSLEYPEDGPQTNLHSVTRTNCPVSLLGLLWGTSHELGSQRLEARVVHVVCNFRTLKAVSMCAEELGFYTVFSRHWTKVPLCYNPSLHPSFCHPPHLRRFPKVSDYNHSTSHSFRPKKTRNGIWAKGDLFQTLSEKILQLFSSLTSLARWGCFVEFWTRLTSPIVTLVLVSFIEPILFLWNRICTFYYTRVRPQCYHSPFLGVIQNTPRQGPVFGMGWFWCENKFVFKKIDPNRLTDSTEFIVMKGGRELRVCAAVFAGCVLILVIATSGVSATLFVFKVTTGWPRLFERLTHI